MKQFKVVPKEAPKPSSSPTGATRQEIDSLSRSVGRLIEKDPKKAAKIFQNWLEGSAGKDRKKKAA
jgi:flagellar biosynthesis/type III secretory pathway M-ring protein FliF/YscJ